MGSGASTCTENLYLSPSKEPRTEGCTRLSSHSNCLVTPFSNEHLSELLGGTRISTFTYHPGVHPPSFRMRIFNYLCRTEKHADAELRPHVLQPADDSLFTHVYQRLCCICSIAIRCILQRLRLVRARYPSDHDLFANEISIP